MGFDDFGKGDGCGVWVTPNEWKWAIADAKARAHQSHKVVTMGFQKISGLQKIASELVSRSINKLTSNFSKENWEKTDFELISEAFQEMEKEVGRGGHD